MAIVPMANAVFDGIASSAEYNKVVSNIVDLNTRLSSVESLTAGVGSTGSGNATLSTRLGTGVTTANTASAQLLALQTTVNNAAALGSGNNAMNARIVALEAASGGTVPFFHGYSSAGQAITSAAYTPIALSQETIDNVNGHSGVTNSSRYTPVTLGWYEVIGCILYVEGSATFVASQVGGRVQKNGAAVPAGPLAGVFPTPDTASNITPGVWVFGMVQVTNAADYIEIAGVSSYSTSTVAGSFMRCRWVSA